MNRTLQLMVIVILGAVISGCQSIDLKRGWDSVPVKRSRISVRERAPIFQPTISLPRNGYWYTHQDNYKPSK